MKNEPMISVIVPVYNTEKLLSRCLESVLTQTWNNIEIIIVNDCSPGDTEVVLQEYQKNNNNIKYIKHKKNKGLYQARITGSRYATGDYIAFLDSDDYLAIDYYRMMISKSIKEEADIVCSDFVLERESDGYQYIFPFNKYFGDTLYKDEILNTYFELGRYAFTRPVVWNKIYTKDLWDKAFPDLEAIKDNFISFEDVYYTTVLSHYANKLVTIDYKGVYYYQNDGASTSMNDDPKKFERNLIHIGMAMGFVKDFLIKVDRYNKLEIEYNNWLDREVTVWSNTVKNSIMSVSNKNKVYQIIEIQFGRKCKFVKNMFPFNICYMASMEFDRRQEIIRRNILKYDYISFDLFGTLFHLPFIDADDIYEYLDYIFPSELFGGKFSTIRMQAQKLYMNILVQSKPHHSNVHIDDIYQYIIENYCIDLELINKIKQKEIDLLTELPYIRQSALDLFDMAVSCGKKVIITVESVLDESHIQSILQKFNIEDYSYLFVTSKAKTSKEDGSLYEEILSACDIKPSMLYHIGSNWHLDNVIPNNMGIKTFMYTPPKDRLLNYSGDLITSNLTLTYYAYSKQHYNYQVARQYPLFKSLLAVIANKLYDNPIIEYASGSDFNGNPYHIGYYAVGLYVLGVTMWLISQCMDKHINVLVFKRDDYVFKNAIDILISNYEYVLETKFQGTTSETLNVAFFTFQPTKHNSTNFCLYNIDGKHYQNTYYYYDYSPEITGIIREQFTKIYEYNSNVDEYFHSKILEGTLDFTRDVNKRLGKYIVMLDVRTIDMIMPFEKLLNEPTDYDLKIFGDSYIGKYKIKDVWKRKIKRKSSDITHTTEIYGEPEILLDKSRYKKAIYYFILDRKTFKDKVKIKLHNKPKILWILKRLYSILRYMKNFVRGGE